MCHPYPYDLYDKLQRWRTLEAWEVPGGLDCVLWLRRSTEDFSTGDSRLVDPGGVPIGEIRIVAGFIPADGYATLLHEMAHIAVDTNHAKITHGARWRSCYLEAAEEVLGERVVPDKLTWSGVDDAVVKAFRGA